VEIEVRSKPLGFGRINTILLISDAQSANGGMTSLIPHMDDHIRRGLNFEGHGDLVAESKILRSSADIEAHHRFAFPAIP
jgi:hypothetical protein